MNGLHLLQDDKSVDSNLHSEDVQTPTKKRERVVCCATCGHVVTDVSLQVSVDDKHEHVFLNPAGLLYHIRCFSQADGVYVFGEWSTEWTWFPGNAWRYASCTGCHEHLGWAYNGGFFGLIAERIVEQDKPCAP